VSYHTHTLADWLAMTSLATGIFFSLSVPYHLTVDADPVDFDPRSVVSRAIESGRVDRVLVAVANAKHGARCVAVGTRLVQRDVAVWVALLLMGLTAPSSAPKGAAR